MSKWLKKGFGVNDKHIKSPGGLSGDNNATDYHTKTHSSGRHDSSIDSMPPAATPGPETYSTQTPPQRTEAPMDTMNERKAKAMMQPPQYQHPHSYNSNPNTHNSAGPSSNANRTSRGRSSKNSSNSGPSSSTREGRTRHAKDSSSGARRSDSSQRSSRNHSSRQPLNTSHPNNGEHNSNSNNYSYAHSQQHPAPPQSLSHYKGDMSSSNNSNFNDTSIQTAQQQQRRPAYLLHRDLVIGKGSYGQVCIASRGEAEGHGRQGGKRKKFACKCVVLRNDPKYIAKLQEEVNVLRELRGHENVIRLYDVFCVDNELFIITELGRGGDLFHLLTTHPKHGVTEAYAAKTVAQMLSAVAFLHCRHICHRDLKLENWVLESGRDVWSPLKLIDFGLSTHFTPGHRLSRVVGSSYYVAPEVLKKSYTEACDLWSLGVIVYMLLSGAPPFYGKNDEAIKASIVNGEYTFPHELFRDVSDEAMAFVSTLLSYNTEYRYTADQALTHPWLAANCDPEQLQKAKDGARGIGAPISERPEPMQM